MSTLQQRCKRNFQFSKFDSNHVAPNGSYLKFKLGTYFYIVIYFSLFQLSNCIVMLSFSGLLNLPLPFETKKYPLLSVEVLFCNADFLVKETFFQHSCTKHSLQQHRQSCNYDNYSIICYAMDYFRENNYLFFLMRFIIKAKFGILEIRLDQLIETIACQAKQQGGQQNSTGPCEKAHMQNVDCVVLYC